MKVYHDKFDPLEEDAPPSKSCSWGKIPFFEKVDAFF
jgi:hypothetical protein